MRDVSGVADAGVADPGAGLLCAARGRRPKHVVVGGRFVVRGYALVDVDGQDPGDVAFDWMVSEGFVRAP